MEVTDNATALFTKRKRSANIRKRTRDHDGNEDQEEEDEVVIAARKPVLKGGLEFSTKKEKQVEKLSYESNRSAVPSGARDQYATATLETETELDKDAQAIKARAGKAPANDNSYRGMASYETVIEKREPNLSSKMQAGPIRAPLFVRNTCRFDYQPDLCKDYKETGYCGYGDACKFMHDRSDYKTGWQLEREWAEQAKPKRGGKTEEPVVEDDAPKLDDDDLPFACFICRNDFTNPVVTKCNHYFCEHCALKHFAKTNKCFACEANTNGIFNRAVKLAEKMKLKKALEEKEQPKQEDDEEEDDTTEEQNGADSGRLAGSSRGQFKAQSGWAIL